MRLLWNKVVKFLREPAVETTIAILTFLTIVWGVIKGWFTGLYLWVSNSWLLETHTWPNWLSLLIGILLIAFTTLWVKSMMIMKARSKKIAKPHGKTYHEVWGVLWG